MMCVEKSSENLLKLDEFSEVIATRRNVCPARREVSDVSWILNSTWDSMIYMANFIFRIFHCVHRKLAKRLYENRFYGFDS